MAFSLFNSTHEWFYPSNIIRGNVKEKSIFKDIIQIEIDTDTPPSYPIFDNFIFDTLLIMLTPLPPLEFWTKEMKF